MTPRAEEALLSVAASISDGGHVDWQQLGAAADDPGVVEQLRIIDRIAQVHAARSSWGSLTIVEQIAHGTFGTVYRAFDNDLHREVALKLTRAESSALAPAFDADRLVREARLLARVRHPNVVTVYGAERKDDEVGVSMELIKGRTLHDVVGTQGPLGAREAALIGVDLCRALAAVHAAGLLHGDIKAQNVMREDGGRIVLMDFGASRDLARTPYGGDDFAGTPLYVAPEVFAGEPRSTASDIYSVGVLLFYLSTAGYPVEGSTRTEITRRHEQQTRRRHLRDVRPDLPASFIEVVERATDVDPARRYASAGAFEAALAHSLGVKPARAGLSGATIALAAGVTLIVGLVGFTYRELSTNRRSTEASVPAGVERLATAPTAADASAGEQYNVEAGMYRLADGKVAPLKAGARLKLGDQLYLQVRTSVPAHVYVVNEDDRGESYLLFPLPNQETTNPLPAERDHRLPGLVNGREMYWQVTTPGGEEHFVIFVSPEPLKEFEQTFASLATPSAGEPTLSARLSERSVGVLRGVGGLVGAPPSQKSAALSAAFVTPLPSGPETTHGTWVRQVSFENP